MMLVLGNNKKIITGRGNSSTRACDGAELRVGGSTLVYQESSSKHDLGQPRGRRLRRQCFKALPHGLSND